MKCALPRQSHNKKEGSGPLTSNRCVNSLAEAYQRTVFSLRRLNFRILDLNELKSREKSPAVFVNELALGEFFFKNKSSGNSSTNTMWRHVE